MRRLSLRSRVLLISLVLAAAGLVVSDAVILGALRQHLVARVDSQLRSLAGIYSAVPPSTVGLLPAQVFGLDLINQVTVVYVAPDGHTEQRLGPPAGATGWRRATAPRRANLVLGTTPPAGATVVVAASLDQVDATMSRVRTICLLSGLAVLAALAGVAWFAVRRGLAPLRAIEGTAAAIAGGDLARRVPDRGGRRTEIGRLSASLNGMLTQLEAAFAARAESEARMRRFVADASHELRTPLFGIRGFAELYRMGGITAPADVDATMARIERESDRLVRLVDDLLLLAPVTLQTAPMDLRTLAADAGPDLRALDPARPVELTGPGGSGAPGPALVVADEARLRQVMANLLGNAVAHTPAGTPVRIGVGVCGDHAVLEVADRGSGMAPEEAARVFDRFYRADASRSRVAGGAGLGLSIARSLVEAHGGGLELDTAPGCGATFRLVLPRVADS
jgi:two-component system, OmpR family, sensor kinase